jgi:hypothetical protein
MDIHWVEEDLLRIREKIFLGGLRRMLEKIEDEALMGSREYGFMIVRNWR